MSFGTFSSNLQPNLRYGFPLTVKFAGMMMDIDMLFSQAVAKNNDRQQLVAYVASQGPRQSANEHLIPEQLFDDPNTNIKDAEAVSAVKALQLAAQAGQKIFTVTQANINTVLPQLQHKALIMEDVRNAVNAGKVVTISQAPINYNGWTGVGYSIVDPQTGAGAWLIGGGADGGYLLSLDIPSLGLDTNSGGYGAIIIGIIGLLGSSANVAGTYTFALALLVFGGVLLVSAAQAYANGNEIAGNYLCNAGLGLIIAALFVASFGNPTSPMGILLTMLVGGGLGTLLGGYICVAN